MTSSPPFRHRFAAPFPPAATWSRSRHLKTRRNLILHAILDHANHFPASKKALLTDNTKDFNTPEVLAALAAIGINRPIRTVENVLGWLGSL